MHPRKTTDYRLLIVLLSLVVYWFCSCKDSHAVTITKQGTDERGLTSVQFIQDGKEWGLDYLTPKELDSLKSIK